MRLHENVCHVEVPIRAQPVLLLLLEVWMHNVEHQQAGVIGIVPDIPLVRTSFPLQLLL